MKAVYNREQVGRYLPKWGKRLDVSVCGGYTLEEVTGEKKKATESKIFHLQVAHK